MFYNIKLLLFLLFCQNNSKQSLLGLHTNSNPSIFDLHSLHLDWISNKGIKVKGGKCMQGFSNY